MGQLPLQIIPRRAYSARNFFRHHGVADAIERMLAYLALDEFRLLEISGPEKSGLTHLSIALLNELSDRQCFPRLIEGSEFFEWANQRALQPGVDPGEVVVVDDADLYLKQIALIDSGHFVSIVELLRKNRAALVLLGHTPLDQIGFDDHVMSRLRAGQRMQITNPLDQDMQQLIAQMAVQRGVQLSKRNLEYLSRRLPRDIQGIDQYLERASQLAEVSGKGFRLPVLSDAITKR